MLHLLIPNYLITFSESRGKFSDQVEDIRADNVDLTADENDLETKEILSLFFFF
jgi:hypothetical protein